ncbi:MAG: hypothetical protein AAF560_29835 [Acidobacteriota bacterium]
MQTDDPFEQLCHVVSTALSLDWEARLRFLERACGDDQSMLREVRSLLAEERALYDGFLETPPALLFAHG